MRDFVQPLTLSLYVLDGGRVRLSDSAAKLLDNADIGALYLGTAT